MILNDDSTPEAADEPVSLDVWRRLYAAAIKVREMEPWKWMEETDVFGVRALGHRSVAFVSVMGLLDEYHAVAVYPSPKELHQFWRMENMPDEERSADQLLDIAQIHAAFGSARDLEAEDKRIIKNLGLKFRGDHSWPCFRSTRPGYFPWFLETQEAHLLTAALEQLLDVAPRVQKDRSILISKKRDDSVLVRKPVSDQPDSPWQETRQPFPPEPQNLRVIVPGELMSAVQALKPTDLTFEVDVFPMPMRIGEKGDRPQCPYGLLVVDSKSFFILGIELLAVETTLEAMWATVPHRVLEMIRKDGMRPAALAVHTPWVHMVLDSACDELGIKLKPTRRLTALETVRRDLEKFNHKM